MDEIMKVFDKQIAEYTQQIKDNQTDKDVILIMAEMLGFQKAYTTMLEVTKKP